VAVLIHVPRMCLSKPSTITITGLGCVQVRTQAYTQVDVRIYACGKRMSTMYTTVVCMVRIRFPHADTHINLRIRAHTLAFLTGHTPALRWSDPVVAY